jgi:hypothetical protein
MLIHPRHAQSDVLTSRYLRNLLLVTRPQIPFAEALVPHSDLPRITKARFCGNLLLFKTIDGGSTAPAPIKKSLKGTGRPGMGCECGDIEHQPLELW